MKIYQLQATLFIVPTHRYLDLTQWRLMTQTISIRSFSTLVEACILLGHSLIFLEVDLGIYLIEKYDDGYKCNKLICLMIDIII